MDASPVGLGAVLILLEELSGGLYLCFKRSDRCRKEVQPDGERSPGTGVGLLSYFGCPITVCTVYLFIYNYILVNSFSCLQ